MYCPTVSVVSGFKSVYPDLTINDPFFKYEASKGGEETDSDKGSDDQVY